MASKTREFLIDLERDGPHTPWGIRLVGGSDLNTPLIITKVQKTTTTLTTDISIITVLKLHKKSI